MKMHDMGQQMPDYSSDAAMTAPGDKKQKMKTVYPELHMSGEMPDLPEGEFHFVGRGKKVGYRERSDGKKECDIAVLSLSPIDAADAKKLALDAAEDKGEAKGKTPRRSLQESLKMAAMDHGEED